MSNDASQGGFNSEVPEVSSRYVSSLDDLAVATSIFSHR